MPSPDRPRSRLHRLIRFSLWTLLVVAALAATVVIGAAVSARHRLPDLQVWHRFSPPSEATAANLSATTTLEDYLAREARVFDEVRTNVEEVLAAGPPGIANRYVPSSRSSPSRLPRDYNRTFEVQPATVRGGAVLLHGLTDAPYSMRAIANTLQAEGYYGVAMRMPGHGTVPGGLVTSTAADWRAAVRVAVRHVRTRIGPSLPLVLVGYSNGGALAVQYALDALDDPTLPRVDRLVLVSPMIGVSPMARMASLISLLGPVPYFEKARWLDVIPEYNPFKYNSFPANAGRQTYDITRELRERIAQAAGNGRLAHMPPVLAFVSLVDATVSTPATVNDLFDRLPANGSALVLFDVNRQAGLDPFIRPGDLALIERILTPRQRHYRMTLISNVGRDSLDVEARDVAPGATSPVAEPLGMAWPREVFSLSHVALPFPPDDPVYGNLTARSTEGPVQLGLLSPRGERSVLTVPVDVLMRVSSNPFFPYVERRVTEWVH